MNRFALAAVVAVAVSFGASGTASAQYVSGSRFVTPGGAVVTNKQVVGLGGVRQFNSVATPFGVRQQSFSRDAFGNVSGRTRGFNTFTGTGYSSGFYRPGAFAAPFGGYNYGFAGRRW